MAEDHSLALCLETSGTTMDAAVRRTSIDIERARRRAMSALYTELGALLPGLSPRASQAQIVEEAVAYVRALSDTAAELEAYRAVGAAEADVTSAETSCFAVRLRAARPGALTRALEVFHRHGVAVVAATVARDGGDAAITITTAAVDPGVAETIKTDIIANA